MDEQAEPIPPATPEAYLARYPGATIMDLLATFADMSYDTAAELWMAQWQKRHTASNAD